MDEPLLANRRLWDERARAHFTSAFYDVDGFRRGERRLDPVELEEIGPVKDRDLLHLQCHFGLDTLSFARLGARVTGIDFSETAIVQARTLAAELALDARFIRADVLDLPGELSGGFDIVYTSRGVLSWIPDLERWAAAIAHCLRAGGLFYIYESHPIAGTFDDEASVLRLRYPYFARAAPQRYRVEGSYADREMRFREKFQYEWAHALGEVITAIAAAGLRIEFVHEFPSTFYEQLPWLVKRGGRWWLPKRLKGELPLSFSLRARRT